MDSDLDDFFHDFRQGLLSGAEANEDFLEAEFAVAVARELEDSGAIEGFEQCQYKAPKGMRVDGYWYGDEGTDADDGRETGAPSAGRPSLPLLWNPRDTERGPRADNESFPACSPLGQAEQRTACSLSGYVGTIRPSAASFQRGRQ